MTGPGDKLKAFMQKLIKPKANGNVIGKSINLYKNLTGDPVEDEKLLYPKKPILDSEVTKK